MYKRLYIYIYTVYIYKYIYKVLYLFSIFLNFKSLRVLFVSGKIHFSFHSKRKQCFRSNNKKNENRTHRCKNYCKRKFIWVCMKMLGIDKVDFLWFVPDRISVE